MTLHASMIDAREKPCVLCGKPPVATGIWCPTASVARRLGQPPGKQRLVVYSLCRKHTKPKFSTAVETRLVADITAALARPEAN